MNKQKMMAEIVEDMMFWSIRDILDYAKDAMWIELDLATDEELQEKYNKLQESIDY